MENRKVLTDFKRILIMDNFPIPITIPSVTSQLKVVILTLKRSFTYFLPFNLLK